MNLELLTSSTVTQESGRKKDNTLGITRLWKASSHKGCDVSLLFSAMVSIHLLKKKKECSGILHLCLCPGLGESFERDKQEVVGVGAL